MKTCSRDVLGQDNALGRLFCADDQVLVGTLLCAGACKAKQTVAMASKADLMATPGNCTNPDPSTKDFIFQQAS